MIGDDVRCDIEGAARVGMKTIHLVKTGDERRPEVSCRTDATVWSLLEVPAAAEGLMAGWSSHAA
jgi:ribonucleotide monophosphatase NagD (HAD superfamily)